MHQCWLGQNLSRPADRSHMPGFGWPEQPYRHRGAVGRRTTGSPALYGGFPGDIPRQRSNDGHLYLTWKDPVAVAPTARPYRTITVVSPPTARLLFAAPARWVSLSGTLLPILGRSVRLSACGREYASYFGAIMVRHWTCVTLAVTGPARKVGTVAVPIGVAQC